jgi:hypothetical protein
LYRKHRNLVMTCLRCYERAAIITQFRLPNNGGAPRRVGHPESPEAIDPRWAESSGQGRHEGDGRPLRA